MPYIQVTTPEGCPVAINCSHISYVQRGITSHPEDGKAIITHGTNKTRTRESYEEVLTLLGVNNAY